MLSINYITCRAMRAMDIQDINTARAAICGYKHYDLTCIMSIRNRTAYKRK